MLENKEKIYNLRAYEKTGELFCERIYPKFEWAKEGAKKIIEKAENENDAISIAIVPMVYDEDAKFYKAVLRGVIYFYTNNY